MWVPGERYRNGPVRTGGDTICLFLCSFRKLNVAHLIQAKKIKDVTAHYVELTVETAPNMAVPCHRIMWVRLWALNSPYCHAGGMRCASVCFSVQSRRVGTTHEKHTAGVFNAAPLVPCPTRNGEGADCQLMRVARLAGALTGLSVAADSLKAVPTQRGAAPVDQGQRVPAPQALRVQYAAAATGTRPWLPIRRMPAAWTSAAGVARLFHMMRIMEAHRGMRSSPRIMHTGGCAPGSRKNYLCVGAELRIAWLTSDPRPRCNEVSFGAYFHGIFPVVTLLSNPTTHELRSAFARSVFS